MRYFLFMLAILPNFLSAQAFQEVDAFAKSVKYTRNYQRAATTLATPYTDEADKARAIFSWIAYHFKYDDQQYEQYQKNSGDRISYSTPEELAQKQQERIQQKIEVAMRKKRGVCQDFSWLYQAMLKEVGIASEFVTGYSRTNPAQMGKIPKEARHAWNAIQVNGQWALCDLTWSVNMFSPQGDDFFLMPPQDFLKSHYPEEEQWQLVDRPDQPGTMGQSDILPQELRYL
jgi:transglutaminase/protease-like cytokinesis protein 3